MSTWFEWVVIDVEDLAKDMSDLTIFKTIILSSSLPPTYATKWDFTITYYSLDLDVCVENLELSHHCHCGH